MKRTYSTSPREERDLHQLIFLLKISKLVRENSLRRVAARKSE
jgi:hypothetical protein